MNKAFLEYEILDDPFIEKGPILIGNPAFSSLGLKVQFLPEKQDSWVANLTKGGTPLSGFWFLNAPNVLILAGGAAYIINTSEKKIIATPGHDNYYNLIQRSDGLLILSDSTKLTVIMSDSSYWDSEQISIDGFKDLEINNNVVSGMSWSPTTIPGKWIPFTFDLETREIHGGSYQMLRSLPKADKS